MSQEKYGNKPAKMQSMRNGKEGEKIDQTVKIEIDDTALDVAMEKANRLVELLQEAQQIVNSLSSKEESES